MSLLQCPNCTPSMNVFIGQPMELCEKCKAEIERTKDVNMRLNALEAQVETLKACIRILMNKENP